MIQHDITHLEGGEFTTIDDLNAYRSYLRDELCRIRSKSKKTERDGVRVVEIGIKLSKIAELIKGENDNENTF